MIYIADTSLDYITGYSIHVLKSVDNFAKFEKKVCLYVPKYQLTNKKIRKKFNLYNLNKIKLKNSFFENKNSFFNRILFGYTSARYAKKNNNKELIITRSMWSSIFLILFKVEHLLEIHSISKGFSNYVLFKLNFINSKYIKKVIVINFELIKYLNLNSNKYKVLADAVDLKNFRYKKRRKYSLKKFLYYGSFYKGRGLDLINQLAFHFKEINFYLVGKENENVKFKDLKNIHIKKKIDYFLVPELLKKFDFILMPYEKTVSANAKSLDTSEYMSPLKMFEALAMGNIILSSNAKVLKKILKNNYNSFIVKKDKLAEWIKLIKYLYTKKNFQNISINAFKTAKFYTWEKRVRQIIDINK